MSLNRKISFTQLQEDVHNALKSWNKYGLKESPIGHLYLFRKRYFNGASPWYATDRILEEGLKRLEERDPSQVAIIRQRFLNREVSEAVAEALEVTLSTFYTLQKEAIDALTHIIQDMEKEEIAERNVLVDERIGKRSYMHLVGLEKPIEDLFELLSTPGPPWIVTVEGLGGIGKTTLAQALIDRFMNENVFYDFGWVTARQRVFASDEDTLTETKPAICGISVEEWLLHQLTIFLSTKLTMDQVTRIITARLKKGAHLIIIDNLEAKVDVEAILPTLRNLVNPTKIILTCRHGAPGESDVYRYIVPELGRQDTYDFIRKEAALRKHFALSHTSDAQLERIYELVGGNPMALRLIVGQAQMYTLDLVLNDLQEARGEKINELYTTIYRHVWDRLDETSRIALLTMPLVISQGGDLGFLKAVTGLNDQDLA